MIHYIHLIKKILLSILILISLNASSQQKLYLSPRPKIIQTEQGSFKFHKSIKICLSSKATSQTQLSSEELTNEILRTYSLTVKKCKNTKNANILMGLLDRDNQVTKKFESLNLRFPDSAKEQGYFLKVSTEGIFIAAYSETGLFYGVQTLKQLIRANSINNEIPAVTITDWPSLLYRGWMDDISRGPIPTMDFIKKCIYKMAEHKQNCFTLYTEHVFKLNKYPDLSPPDGLTAEEVKELTEYAANYHVDFVGNFQSFGHFAKILSNPFFSQLGENDDILNPSDNSSYKFLQDVYEEIAPSYKSQFFNINCDETFGLGEGKSKELARRIGIDGLYSRHINKIDSLLKPYNKRIMMWGDIAVNNPGIINKLPKDLIIISWGYHAADNFENDILPFKNTGFDFMVAPGVSCWNEIWPGMSNAVINISNYVRDGHKHGAIGMINTAWDDNGHNLFNSNWHGLLWGAECSWDALPSSKDELALEQRIDKVKLFNETFDRLFFTKPGITDMLLSIDSIRNYSVPGILNEWGFWSDISDFNILNTSPEYMVANQQVKARVTDLSTQIASYRKANPENAEMLDNAELALTRINFVADRNLIRALLYTVKQTRDTLKIAQAKEQIKSLKDQLYNIKKRYIILWLRENRNWWLEKNLNDYNKYAENLDNVGSKVFIEPVNRLDDNNFIVRMTSLFKEGLIYYTLDGTEPSLNSQYTYDSIILNKPAFIRARVIRDNYIGPITEQFISYHKGIGKLRKLNSKYSSYNLAYAAGGDYGLIDGLKGTNSFSDGRWQGYQGQDLDIELDLNELTIISKISIDFLQNSYSWILLPKDIVIQVSDDGKSYKTIQTLTHNIPLILNQTVIHTFEYNSGPLMTRFIRLIAHNPGLLPGDHHASGNPSFIFADEIVLQ